MKNTEDQSLNPFARRTPRSTEPVSNDLGEATNLADNHEEEEARIATMVPQDATTEAGYQRMLEILGKQSAPVNPVIPEPKIPQRRVSQIDERAQAIDTFAEGVKAAANAIPPQVQTVPPQVQAIPPQVQAIPPQVQAIPPQVQTMPNTFNAAQNSPGNPFAVAGASPMNYGMTPPPAAPNPYPAPRPQVQQDPASPTPSTEVTKDPEKPAIKDEDVLPLVDSIMTRGYASESFSIRGARVVLRSQFFWEDQRIIELTDERSRDITLRATSAFYFQVYALAANLVEFGGNYFKPMAQGDPAELRKSFDERVEFLLSLPSVIVSHLYNKRQSFVDKMSYMVENFDKLVESF